MRTLCSGAANKPSGGMRSNPGANKAVAAPRANHEPDLFDVCWSRHRGNPESVAANQDNSKHRDKQRARVLQFIKDRGTLGATTDEIAVAFETTPNSVSGRISELKYERWIEKRGRRETRSGSSAGVYVAI